MIFGEDILVESQGELLFGNQVVMLSLSALFFFFSHPKMGWYFAQKIKKSRAVVREVFAWSFSALYRRRYEGWGFGVFEKGCLHSLGLGKSEFSLDCRKFTSRTLLGAACSLFWGRAIAVRVGYKVAGAIDVRAFDWCAF